MNEFELKLEIPAARLKDVQKDVARLKGSSKVLRATYYDTPAHALQRRGLALRVRDEGGEWLQTLKAGTGRPLERLEQEVSLGHRGPQAPLPAIDAHDGSAVGKRLRKAVGESGDGDVMWSALFATEVHRTAALVREADSQVEIAFDCGRIAAGDEELALRELEFELKEGSPADAVALARRWLARHRLWLDSVSKFEKGQRLAAGVDQAPPVMARAPDCGGDTGVDALARAALAACLDQVLGNASEVAAGHATQGHIHQLRVGIRRTRTALRHLFNAADDSIETALVHAFRVLGQRRDVEHVVQQLDPVIRAAGGPALETAASARSQPSAAAVVRAPAFQDALLQLVELAHREDGGREQDARPFVSKQLKQLRDKVLDDGLRFGQLDPARQHRVRKRLKRLRYLAEFAAPLFPARKAGPFIERLKPVQDALGLYNDERTAQAWYRDRANTDARAFFAVGWLAAREERQADVCAAALRDFAGVKPFWKGA